MISSASCVKRRSVIGVQCEMTSWTGRVVVMVTNDSDATNLVGVTQRIASVGRHACDRTMHRHEDQTVLDKSTADRIEKPPPEWAEEPGAEREQGEEPDAETVAAHTHLGLNQCPRVEGHLNSSSRGKQRLTTTTTTTGTTRRVAATVAGNTTLTVASIRGRYATTACKPVTARESAQRASTEYWGRLVTISNWRRHIDKSTSSSSLNRVRRERQPC
jgi:hypothetical protein